MGDCAPIMWDEFGVDLDGAPWAVLDGRRIKVPERYDVDKHWAYLQGYNDGVIAERDNG